MNQERCSFYYDWISQSHNDQRQLFRKAKTLLGLNSNLSLPLHSFPAELSNEFANFFIQKVNIIKTSIASAASPTSSIPYSDPDILTRHQLSQFSELSDEEIKRLVTSAPNKTCYLDPIPTQLIKSSLHVLAPTLKKLINTSLSTGHFQSAWKRAIIRPKLKKPNLDPILSNYRPLSNLSFLSKLTEKAVSAQIVDHLTAHNLFPGTQFAYRKHHSTEPALLKVKNDILLNMNRQHVTLLVLLDLSSAFDTIDHTILLHRLQTHFGISNTSLSWFRSYLSDRQQYVSINESPTADLPLEHGIPQGSCLGPLLFTLYTSPLFEIIRPHLPEMHCYADDTQNYLAFKPNPTTSENPSLIAIESCISDIRAWLLNNSLLINDAKTEFQVIGTRQQLSKVHLDSLTI